MKLQAYAKNPYLCKIFNGWSLNFCALNDVWRDDNKHCEIIRKRCDIELQVMWKTGFFWRVFIAMNCINNVSRSFKKIYWMSKFLARKIQKKLHCFFYVWFFCQHCNYYEIMVAPYSYHNLFELSGKKPEEFSQKISEWFLETSYPSKYWPENYDLYIKC